MEKEHEGESEIKYCKRCGAPMEPGFSLEENPKFVDFKCPNCGLIGGKGYLDF